jgi:hypothetical protein
MTNFRNVLTSDTFVEGHLPGGEANVETRVSRVLLLVHLCITVAV